MKNLKILIATLCCLVLILILLAGYVFIYPISHHSTPKITKNTLPKQPESSQEKPLLNLQIKDNKLPLQKIFDVGTFGGTLTYQNAISIAKSYYEKGDYQDSLVWAYRADRVSNLDINAWLIYALSLYKLGYPAEAIALLDAYRILKETKK